MMKTKKITDNSAFKFLVLVCLPVILVAVCQTRLPNYYRSLFSLFLINVILTSSLNLTNGFTGIFSIGHAGFMAIGAYISSLLTLSAETKAARIENAPQWLVSLHVPFPAAIIIAGLIAMGLAALVGFPILRAKGDYLSVMTLGLVIIIKSVIDNNPNITNGSKGLGGMKGYSTLPVTFCVTVLVLYLLHKIVRSSFGRTMIAIRDDSPAAVSLGINVLKYRVLSFALSAFFGAAGGAMWAHLQKTIASSFFYLGESFDIVQMSVLGGMFTLSGSIPGALIITFLPQVLSRLESGFTLFGYTFPNMYGLSEIIMCIIFICVLIFRPNGIMGSSDYIIDGIFDSRTYTGLFQKETWKELFSAVKPRSNIKKTKVKATGTVKEQEGTL